MYQTEAVTLVFEPSDNRVYSMVMRLLPSLAILVLILSVAAIAQTTNSSQKQDSERLIYVIPNNLSVEHPQTFTPIDARTKFKLAAEDIFDPYVFIIAGLNAGVEQAARENEEYGQGMAGFAKRYGAYFGDETTGDFLGSAVYPVLFRQDPRYFRMEHGNIWRRSRYALSRSVWTRDDRGGFEFNVSNVLGAYTGSAISNAYYPAADRTLGQTIQRGSVMILEDSVFNLLKEFWPDIHTRLRRRKSNP
jgi:hypothetical protein